MRIAIDHAAWDEGRSAAEAALPRTCPYPPGTPQAWSWHSGYVQARSTAYDSVDLRKAVRAAADDC